MDRIAYNTLDYLVAVLIRLLTVSLLLISKLTSIKTSQHPSHRSKNFPRSNSRSEIISDRSTTRTDVKIRRERCRRRIGRESRGLEEQVVDIVGQYLEFLGGALRRSNLI
jgi:hypothetical protein